MNNCFLRSAQNSRTDLVYVPVVAKQCITVSFISNSLRHGVEYQIVYMYNYENLYYRDSWIVAKAAKIDTKVIICSKTQLNNNNFIKDLNEIEIHYLIV